MRKIPYVLLILALAACTSRPAVQELMRDQLQSDSALAYTKQKALEIIKTGFNAGEGYEEVWIRDYNTFIELAVRAFEPSILKEQLLVFFRMQGEDGNILDGFVPAERARLDYDYKYFVSEPRYAGHKNTVETDQETSLVQTVYKYLQFTGDSTILKELVDGKTVAERLEWSMDFLMKHRYNQDYGLIWGATTTDWGDVQPEHEWGVFLTEDTHYALDIYDNAMFLVALDMLMEMIPSAGARWLDIRKQLADNVRTHLWDETRQKFIPHIYLDGSPFPEDFNEREIYYHGGTAVAIEAGLLTPEEIMVSLDHMLANVEAAGAASIGLTLYPAYPDGFFKNPSMHAYGYQNGGDWTWFGARMIHQLIRYGFVEEAYEHLKPMIERVKENDGFYEWYTVENEARGSGTFRGSAGVLYTAIRMLEEALIDN
jgi:glycogen debranching enzyme